MRRRLATRAAAARRGPTALIAGFALLLLCWTFANPPFAAPDEWSHYLRAVGISSGQAIGEPAAVSVPAGAPAWLARRIAWTNEATRVVHVPAGLFAPFYQLQCTSVSQTTTAGCLSRVQPITHPSDQLTPVGNYQPIGYALPAALMRLGDGPLQDDRLGRLGSVVLCLALLALAVALLFDGGALSLLGLALAVTPMVLFCAASLNPSGLEICSGVAFAAAMLRLARGPGGGRLWAAAATAGVLLALSRSPGPIWVLLAAGAAIALAGPRGAWRTARDGGAAAAACGLAIAAAIVGNRLWESAYGSKLPLHPGSIWSALGGAVTHFPTLVYEQFGVFGALDSPLPALAYVVAGTVLGTVVTAALLLGRRRQAIVLLGVLVACVVIPVSFDAAFTAGTGFNAQGRHVLPFTVLLPLLAGEILAGATLPAGTALLRRGLMLAAGTIAALQFAALYANGRRQSVGADGPLWFVPSATWQPPLGWWLWLAAAALGGVLIALFAVAGPPARPGRRRRARLDLEAADLAAGAARSHRLPAALPSP